MMEKKCKWVILGDYIQELDVRNDNQIYGVESIRGVSNTKLIQKTKANVKGRNLSPFHVVKKDEFVFNRRTTRNGERLGLGYNNSSEVYLFTEDYVHFEVKDKKVLLPGYLYLLFLRDEFDRYVRYNSWGSATEFFNWEDMCRVEIPLPSIEEQQKVVNAWKALREIKEQNEAIASPLMQMCQSYIQELKHEYEAVEIGEYIEEVDERNTTMSVKLSQGIANTKVFQDPKQVAANSKSDKIVRKGYFGYNRATTRNGEKISIALRVDEDCTVSSAYGVFKVTHEEILNPYFLWMWFSRSEFDRYARYMSKGSAHEFFDMDDMRRVKIPLPPIEKQQAIVNIYNCANEAKKIAAEADRMSREVCSALIQHVIHN